jgi:hypothetical protein
MDVPGQKLGKDRERLVAFLHRDWLIVVIILVAIIFSVVATTTLSFLENRDIQSNNMIGDKAPLRNLFELFYFVAGVAVAVIAAWAIYFARQQAGEAKNSREEAEHARIVSIYMQISSLWNSHRIMSSKMYILGLKDKFENDSHTDQDKSATKSSANNSVEDYIRRVLVSEQKRDRVRHNQRTAMLTFLEDLGILCARGYVREVDIFEFISPPIVHQINLLSEYITELRKGGENSSLYENALALRDNAQKFLDAKDSRPRS